ncbi:Clavaminate synthase-like protein [Hymenopellis radicata]|nr:Clavaminate synthase-like protein [Hymenopellis radicata]
MTVDTVPYLNPYIFPPPTKEPLPYADLPIIDLAKIATDEGRAELVRDVRAAFSDHGFLYIVNHGLSPEQTKRMFDIGELALSDAVSDEEKKKYESNTQETGSYQGYKLRKYWHINNGVRDECEMYNINRDVTKRGNPVALRPYMPEIEKFGLHNHLNVLHPLLRLLALGLGLEKNRLVDLHGYSSVGESFGMFLLYWPRSQEDEEKSGQVWLKGHSDFGSITLLYSQPVAALQILSRSGEWKWVKHIDNAMVVNAGDSLEFLSGGLYRATIHRVVQPPKDQQQYARLGVFYFALPNDDVALAPLADSPTRLLGRASPNVAAWRKERTKAYGKSQLVKKENGDEEELINGVVVKHYN